MKKLKFAYLFSQKKPEQERQPTPNAKKTALVFFTLFFLLYLNHKPYESAPHQIASITEYLFTIYRFIIVQTLGIAHESGHGICYILPCPQFLMVAMGTLFQWGFPLSIAYWYKKQGNAMAFLAGLFILGISMDHTAWYMSTAHEGAILLANKSFLGVDALHDFHYIFSALGVFEYEALISGFTKAVGYLLMIGALIGMFFEAFSNKN